MFKRMRRMRRKMKHNRAVKRRRRALFECKAEPIDGRILVKASGYEGQPYHAIALEITRLLKLLKIKRFTVALVDIEHTDGVQYDMKRLDLVLQKYYRNKS